MPVMPATLRGSSGTIRAAPRMLISEVSKPSDRPALAASANARAGITKVVVQHVR